MYYKNKTHQRIFEEQVNGNPCKCPNEYLAALYLLTADRDLWRAAKYEIERKVIDFSKIRPKEYTTNNYTVFIVAKDIYKRNGRGIRSKLIPKRKPRSNNQSYALCEKTWISQKDWNHPVV